MEKLAILFVAFELFGYLTKTWTSLGRWSLKSNRPASSMDTGDY